MSIKISIAQIAPVWLNKEKTIDKIVTYIEKASNENSDLVIFGEAILPGYPFWVEKTDGARFNSDMQKKLYSHYVSQSIDTNIDLETIKKSSNENNIAIILGCIERPAERGGHSLYCSMVYIDKSGEIRNIHRKLMPTYEERLVWSIGDGHGLNTFKINDFTFGGLNCWENWMPLVRSALYAQGENLHIAIWPGSKHNTEDISKVIAKESRSYVVSVSGLMRREDIPKDIHFYDEIYNNFPDIAADGGSCMISPDGNAIIEPLPSEEILITKEIFIEKVLEERQNFDPSGHYSRPDVTKLVINKSRNSILSTNERL